MQDAGPVRVRLTTEHPAGNVAGRVFTTRGHHVNAADYDPEFVARSPQLTAERLRHAEFMRQHWYDALDSLRRQHAEMAAVCERLVRLEGGCGGITCNIGVGLCSECCVRRMTLLARIRELLGMS